MLKDKKTLLIVVIILLIIIIAGITVTTVKGMNYGFLYEKNTTIKMYLEKNFESSEIEEIITNIFGNNKIRTANNLKGNLIITVESASEEQLNNLVTKLNEKYNLDITTEDLEISNNPRISGKDLIFPYITPVVTTAIIVLIYFMARYRKLGLLKILVYSLSAIIGVQLIYLSIYSIIRIPVNQLTMPISMLLFILSNLILIEIYEKQTISNKKSQK